MWLRVRTDLESDVTGQNLVSSKIAFSFVFNAKEKPLSNIYCTKDSFKMFFTGINTRNQQNVICEVFTYSSISMRCCFFFYVEER